MFKKIKKAILLILPLVFLVNGVSFASEKPDGYQKGVTIKECDIDTSESLHLAISKIGNCLSEEQNKKDIEKSTIQKRYEKVATGDSVLFDNFRGLIYSLTAFFMTFAILKAIMVFKQTGESKGILKSNAIFKMFFFLSVGTMFLSNDFKDVTKYLSDKMIFNITSVLSLQNTIKQTSEEGKMWFILSNKDNEYGYKMGSEIFNSLANSEMCINHFNQSYYVNTAFEQGETLLTNDIYNCIQENKDRSSFFVNGEGRTGMSQAVKKCSKVHFGKTYDCGSITIEDSSLEAVQSSISILAEKMEIEMKELIDSECQLVVDSGMGDQKAKGFCRDFNGTSFELKKSGEDNQVIVNKLKNTVNQYQIEYSKALSKGMDSELFQQDIEMLNLLEQTMALVNQANNVEELVKLKHDLENSIKINSVKIDSVSNAAALNMITTKYASGTEDISGLSSNISSKVNIAFKSSELEFTEYMSVLLRDPKLFFGEYMNPETKEGYKVNPNFYLSLRQKGVEIFYSALILKGTSGVLKSGIFGGAAAQKASTINAWGTTLLITSIVLSAPVYLVVFFYMTMLFQILVLIIELPIRLIALFHIKAESKQFMNLSINYLVVPFTRIFAFVSAIVLAPVLMSLAFDTVFELSYFVSSTTEMELKQKIALMAKNITVLAIMLFFSVSVLLVLTQFIKGIVENAISRFVEGGDLDNKVVTEGSVKSDVGRFISKR